jgi:hypothetical protein
MIRTILATSLAFIVLTAFVPVAWARADTPYPGSISTYFEETSSPVPLRSNGLGGTWNDVSGNSSTGPTFPPACHHWGTPSVCYGD